MDLHSPQIQGFFRIPVDHLYALPVLVDAFATSIDRSGRRRRPDAGFAKKARLYAKRLSAPMAIADKERIDHSETAHVVDLIGDVKGRNALIVDDFTITAGTLVEVAECLMSRVPARCTPSSATACSPATPMERLERSPIARLLCTDTVENQPDELSSKVQVVSVAPLFAEAIRRIHQRESVSVLFAP